MKTNLFSRLQESDIDRLVDCLDSPKLKIVIIAILGFAAGYFGPTVIEIFSR